MTEIVANDFFTRLPVTQVVTSLEDAARNNICSATNLKPEQLPNPLLTKEDVETAIQPLREAVASEVRELEETYKKKLNEDLEHHRTELAKRRRLPSFSSDGEDEDDELLVGTYACEHHHVCNNPCLCEDERTTAGGLEYMEDCEKLKYINKYLKTEMQVLQDRLDLSVMRVDKSGIAIDYEPVRRTKDFPEHLHKITPAAKRVMDSDETKLEVLKDIGYSFGNINERKLFFSRFIAEALPLYVNEHTHKLDKASFPFGVNGMIALSKQGVGFTHYNEHELHRNNNKLTRELAKIYAVAIMLRGHQFKDEEYEEMEQRVKECGQADHSW